MEKETLTYSSSAMDRETLISFSFVAPYNTKSVELLGSWDNFTHAYPLDLDYRRGNEQWTGCFQFRNIIFDGTSLAFTTPRNGGLRQGGLYWYFFRLDDSIEAYDSARDCTNCCPLLPGQTLNFIEVPQEIIEADPRPRSELATWESSKYTWSRDYPYTLDPATKYKPLCPPELKSHARCFSYNGGEAYAIKIG